MKQNNHPKRKFMYIFITLILSFIMLTSAAYPVMGASASTRTRTVSSSGTVSQMKTYFQADFSTLDPPTFSLNTDWPSTEPCAYPNQEGTWQWVNDGPTNGDMKLVPDPTNSKSVCLQMILDAPGTRPLPNNQQVKLYEIQAREPQLWGAPYTTTKAAYWQMQYYFPTNMQVASWRVIWQLCGEESVFGNLTDYPQLRITLGPVGMYLISSGFYYSDGQDRTFTLANNAGIPKGQWVTITVYVKQGTAFQAQDGTVDIWINNALVFSSNSLSTATYTGTPYVIWGIGNYGSPYEAQGQYVDIKDVKVTSQLVP